MPDGATLPAAPFTDALAVLRREGAPVALVRDGVTVAVLVSPDDMARWEALEDAADDALAAARLAEYDRTGGAGSVSLEQVMARAGLTAADVARDAE